MFENLAMHHFVCYNGALVRVFSVDTWLNIILLNILFFIWSGIEYLHSNRANKPPLLHQNISAEKVLLDRHFMSHLSNAGVHKLLADDIIFSALKSSAAMGYLAPEYTTTGRFTEKSDIYAFGVLTLQILTGMTKKDLCQLPLWSYHLQIVTNILCISTDTQQSNWSTKEIRLLELVEIL